MMFGTSGVRGQFGDDITPELGVNLGRAVAQTVVSTAVIGRDPRTSSPILADAVSIGLREYGVDVIDTGEVATPTLARSVSWYGGDVGVMITASHNPPTDNGIKLWNPSGMAFGESQQDRIATLMQDSVKSNPDLNWNNIGDQHSRQEATQRHLEQLIDAGQQIDGDLSVVVDVGNGMGGITVDALQALGCTVQTINASPDGHFPSRSPEPTAESCSTLQGYVAATDADLGIAHDGDADRMMATDDQGQFVGGDRLLGLFAQECVDSGDQIAVPINTSLVVDDVVSQQGGHVTRTKVGDVYVAAEASQPGHVFGGEPSGCWIWPDQTLCPDAPLAAVKLAGIVANRGPLSSLVERLPEYPIRRHNYDVEQKSAVMDRVQNNLDRYDGIETVDGIRVDTADGWFLIRPSGTEPVVRLTAQGRTPEQTDRVFDEANNLVNTALSQLSSGSSEQN